MEARSGSDAELTLGAGRNRVPMGQVLTRAGHFDRYGQMPLAKRAAFNGDWIEDGVNAAWRPHLQGAMSWLQGIDLGLWRARRFPGSDNAAWAPVVHASAAWTSVQADAFYSRMQPKGAAPMYSAPTAATSTRRHSAMPACATSPASTAPWTWPGPAPPGPRRCRASSSPQQASGGAKAETSIPRTATPATRAAPWAAGWRCSGSRARAGNSVPARNGSEAPIASAGRAPCWWPRTPTCCPTTHRAASRPWPAGAPSKAF